MTTEVVFKVRLLVGGDADEMANLFIQYLSRKDTPFLTDYGPDAWGGWDGPFVLGVTVTREAG